MPSSPLDLSTPTPIDPFERREEWRFALLVLALVAAQGGGARSSEGSVVVKGDQVRTTAPPPASSVGLRRGVRPPRSC